MVTMSFNSLCHLHKSESGSHSPSLKMNEERDGNLPICYADELEPIDFLPINIAKASVTGADLVRLISLTPDRKGVVPSQPNRDRCGVGKPKPLFQALDFNHVPTLSARIGRIRATGG